VIDEIKKEPQKNFTLDKIAQSASFSSFHFHRIFTTVTGETPAKFIRRHRILRSLEMLLHQPGKSITEIALDSGFSSSANFSKAFKNLM
jgi:AraC family transcriptional regulator